MRVGVGADHGGFDMKNELAKLLAGVLNAKFSGADRHRRRLAKVLEVEQSRTGAVADHD